MQQTDLPDVSGIPARRPDQDEHISVLVVRKDGSTPDNDEAVGPMFVQALAQLMELGGYSVTESYIAVSGTDVDVADAGSGHTTVGDFLSSVG